MSNAVEFLLTLVLGGVAVLIVAAVVPGFRIRGGLGSAIFIGFLYGLLKAILQTILIVVTLPLVVVTFGLFILLINAFLLWLTDKLLTRFEVSSLGSLLLGAFLLSVVDYLFRLFLSHSAFV